MGIQTDVLYKYTSEARGYSVDFVNLLATGDSLATVTSVVSGDGLTTEGGTISGTEVSFNVSAGTSGTTYEVIVTVVTTDGETLSGRGRLSIDEGYET